MTGPTRISRALVCECGNLKMHKHADGCPECIRLNDEHFSANVPSMRIRRLLENADWLSAVDVFEALNVDRGRDSREREAYSQALARLVASGALERRGVTNGEMQYRALIPLPSMRPLECVFIGDLPVIKRTVAVQLQWLKSKRAERMAKGLCRECDQPKGKGVLCDRHAEMARKQYHARRAAVLRRMDRDVATRRS